MYYNNRVNYERDCLFMRILIVLVLIFIAAYLFDRFKKKKSNPQKSNDIYTDAKTVEFEESDNTECNNYSRKNLLTKNEWCFYKSLKPIADKYDLAVLSKVRVADLVEPKHNLDKSTWQTAFNRINKKHIDFILCNKDNLYPLLLIELDDKSHDTDKVKERDEFIESLYKSTGYNLLRVNGPVNLESKIVESLNLEN